MRTIQSYFLLMILFSLAAKARAENPAINGEPLIRPNGSIVFLVQGEFRPSVDSARDSALHTAQEKMRDWLSRQDPAIRRAPSMETIRREMKPHEFTLQEEQILNQQDRMYRMMIEVEMQPKHVRALRESERVTLGLWTLGGILGILAVIAALFFVDEWTKGYLTRWLIAGGLMLFIGLAVLWWWGK
ncbi:MAG: hypothetical protein K8T89_07510 [Planctomycetes bacterium]|nr:hypothetical protein [Planctomycetota bacterium]